MGYDLHITRKAHWADEDGATITLLEWKAYIRTDPEMRLDGYAEAQTPAGERIRSENEGLSVWLAYSGHEQQGNMAWFDYWNGTIVVKNPDEEIIRKMYAIAQKFDAKVQGDDGEYYGPDGQPIKENHNLYHFCK